MPDNDFSQEDYDAPLYPNLRSVVGAGALANPDKAAEAVQLSKSTGVPAQVIQLDQDKFKANLKAKTAGDIAMGNPHIAAFVTDDPMAAKVASDDLGNLDGVSQAAQQIKPKSALRSVADAFSEGLDTPGVFDELKQLHDYSNSPTWRYGLYPLLAVAGLGLEGAARIPNAVLSAGQEALSQAGQAAGMSQSTADYYTSGLRSGIDFLALHGMSGNAGVPVPPEMNAMARAAQKAEPYVKAGKEPPVGLDPTLDKFKKEESEAQVDAIAETYKAAQASTTRERAPDMFRDFMAQHVGEETVGLSADHAKLLYGDKLPEEGDNLLGWVPGIAQQYDTAMTTGADIQIPLADLLAKMAPEVFDQVEDGLRPSPEGFTKAEEIPPVATEGVPLLDRANAIGMTEKQLGRYERLITDQQDQINADALRRAEDAERQRQTPEWNANRIEMLDQVTNEVTQQPRFMVDMGIRLGDIPKMSIDALTDEQKEGLPRSYYAKDGMLPDRIAQIVGYDSGSEMLRDLTTLHVNRSGVEPGRYLTDLISRETDRRMEAKYGNLDRRVIEDAKAQTLSQTNLDLQHAELEALAAEHGIAMPYTKDALAVQVQKAVGDMPMAQAKSDHFISAAARVSNQIESALLNGDPALAFRARQAKWHALSFAKEIDKVEKLQKAFNKIAKKYRKPEVKNSIGEYNDAIQLVLSRMGQRTGRIEDNIAESLNKAGYKDLDDFVAHKVGMGFTVDKPEFLDNNFRKPVEQMTTREFKGAATFLKQLAHYAIDENKVMVAGRKEDFNEIMEQMSGALADRKQKPLGGSSRERNKTVGSVLKHAFQAHLNLEKTFDTLDKWDPGAVFNQTFTRVYTDGAYQLESFIREYAKKTQELFKDVGNLSTKIENTLWREGGDGPLINDMNRGHLLKILANVGNSSNRARLFGGYKIDEAVGMQWLHEQMLRDPLGLDGMLKWAKAQGDLFNELLDKADNMQRNLSDTGIDKLPIDGVDIGGKHYEGWFHPVDRDPIWDNSLLRRLEKTLYTEGYYRATTAQGHWQERVENFRGGPIDLSLDSMPGVIRQMLHDIAMRPAAEQLGKFFYNKKFDRMIREKVSPEFADQLVPFLKDMVNSANSSSEAGASFNRIANYITSNAVSTLIGFNPSTVIKHTFSAGIKSLASMPVGFTKEFARLVYPDSKTGLTGVRLAFEKSDECNRRLQNFREHMATTEGTDIDIFKYGVWGALKRARNAAQWAGSSMIGFLDLVSSMANFNAAYKAEIAKGTDEGMARYIGNKFVRQTHGSSLFTNKPMVVRSTNPMVRMMGQLYSFYSENTQMLSQAADRMKEAYNIAGDDLGKAVGHIQKAAMLGFISTIVPGAIDFATMYTGKEMGLWDFLGHAIFGTIGAGFIGVRDMMNAVIEGRDPGGGLLSTVEKSVVDPVRDLIHHKRWTPAVAGKFIKDMFVLNGIALGITTAPEGKLAEYTYRYFHHLEHPNNLWQWGEGLRYGTNKGHSTSATDWGRWLRREVVGP